MDQDVISVAMYRERLILESSRSRRQEANRKGNYTLSCHASIQASMRSGSICLNEGVNVFCGICKFNDLKLRG